MASAGPWGRWGCDCANSPLCFLVILLQLNLCPYQTEAFQHCPLKQCLCAFSFRARWMMGLQGICCEQLSWSTVQSTFPKQILPHDIYVPVCGSCVHTDFCEAEGLDSHHLLSCFVSMLMLAIPRAVLVSNPSLWTNTCVNRKLAFFLGRIFKERTLLCTAFTCHLKHPPTPGIQSPTCKYAEVT